MVQWHGKQKEPEYPVSDIVIAIAPRLNANIRDRAHTLNFSFSIVKHTTMLHLLE